MKVIHIDDDGNYNEVMTMRNKRHSNNVIVTFVSGDEYEAAPRQIAVFTDEDTEVMNIINSRTMLRMARG
jgi:hypothetical protein